MINYCPECGTYITPEHSKFCHKCGTNLNISSLEKQKPFFQFNTITGIFKYVILFAIAWMIFMIFLVMLSYTF